MKKLVAFNIGTSLILAFWEWFLFKTILEIDINLAGEYALLLAFIAPVYLLSNANLKPLILSSKSFSTEKDAMLALRLLTIVIFLLSCIVLIFFTDNTSLLLALFALKISSMIFDFTASIDLKKNSHKLLFFKNLTRIISIIILLVLLKENGYSISEILLYIFFVNMFFILIFEHKKLVFHSIPDFGKVKALLKVSSLGLFIPIFDSLASNVPKYLLGTGDMLELVAVFTALYYLTQVAGVFANSVSSAIMPTISDYIHSSKVNEIIKLLSNYGAFVVLITLIGAIIASFLGGEILQILYNEDIAEYSDLLVLIILLTGVWCLSGVFLCLLNAARSFNVQFTSLVIMLLINVVFITIILVLSDYYKQDAHWTMTSIFVALNISYGVRLIMLSKAAYAIKSSIK